MQSTSCKMLGWMMHKLKSKFLGKYINNLRHADNSTLMAESEEELKSLLMRVKEESEKARLKLNIKKTNILASSPITSWQIEGEMVEPTGSKLGKKYVKAVYCHLAFLTFMQSPS